MINKDNPYNKEIEKLLNTINSIKRTNDNRYNKIENLLIKTGYYYFSKKYKNKNIFDFISYFKIKEELEIELNVKYYTRKHIKQIRKAIEAEISNIYDDRIKVERLKEQLKTLTEKRDNLEYIRCKQ